MSFTKLVTALMILGSASAFASTLNGSWTLDSTIPMYCNVHPEAYTKEELWKLEKARQGLPVDFVVSIEGSYARETFWDYPQHVSRHLSVLETSAPGTYQVNIEGTTGVEGFRYFLRPSSLGSDRIELLNIDTETCGLNHGVVTLKRDN